MHGDERAERTRGRLPAAAPGTGLQARAGRALAPAAGRLPGGHRRDVTTIRHAKFDRSRLVPLHPTVTEALSRYVAEHDRLCPRPCARAFFVSSAGPRLDRSGVSKTLRKITTSLGIRTETVHPRAHDPRHSFAVDTRIRWQRSELSVDEHIATLSTYLGHVSPADTYWYLSGRCPARCRRQDRCEHRRTPRGRRLHMDLNPDYVASDEIENFFSWLPWALRGVYTVSDRVKLRYLS
ncbi:tyrosine-type recombinase/integrase [Mycobacterium sp. CVI_P3]|uniref:Tyrosine-type recombinase/integrase n=1 Tax=Mycobacterium pinniadriaticum TaxID=2994102 RepID=A0ABT3SMD2_9MYCO|nr:tyrosine-type recombinase/integrase [Mycobacterium pinniadriaticum]MCX2934278.1 tyrosine-type recombinase/integrase [Mycobacterium pinniadriaticum]MCX2940684.1 tyrosine-type recombinase/integrase [Mycobacterium pinniadriaticum]